MHRAGQTVHLKVAGLHITMHRQGDRPEHNADDSMRWVTTLRAATIEVNGWNQ
jgi:2'-5' RNA ligase